LQPGVSPSLFDLPPHKPEDPKKAPPRSEQKFRGKVAACAEVFVRADESLNAACVLTAKLLSIQGHQKKYARKSERLHDRTITPGTVRAWRKRALKGEEPDHDLAISYREWLDMAEKRHREHGESYGLIGRNMVTILAHANPGGRDLVTALRAGFGQKGTNGR
jgi:hypothetical protein